MSFHFNFDVDDPADDVAVPVQPTVSTPLHPFSEIDLDTLLDALPSQLSYSFIPELNLARRDLFDARFQLISEGTGDPEFDGSLSLASALQFIDNPSDLVHAVYEGGLKTWECSLDLASCLRRDGHAHAKGKRVLELGCGTAIPTLCILRDLFASPITEDAETEVHLQDYNASVLKLVTVPNIVLAWHTSPAAAADGRSLEPEASDADVVHVTPELVRAFKTALDVHRLRLRFFCGAWQGFDVGGVCAGSVPPYHLVLTSETIYHPDALPGLVRALKDARGSGNENVCLVAAKTVYFGVGGGVVEFVRAVESVGGRVETVWENATGVNRRVMRVWWS